MIRPERADDPREVGAIGDVVAAAFGSPVEAELVAAIRASEHYIPQAALVATQGGRIAGHVMVSYVLLDTGHGTRRICSLSPLAVAPTYQGLGVGSALVRAVLDLVDRMDEPLVVLEGSPTYYGRLGFEHSVPHGITIHLPDWAPAETAQIYRLRNYDPAIRGQVAYPPAFDAATAASASLP